MGLGSTLARLRNNLQQQINVTDSLSYTVAAHQLKFGVDYRRLNSEVRLCPHTSCNTSFCHLSNVIANKVPAGIHSFEVPGYALIFPNWSLFAQDTWNITRTLTITYGLRWDYNGAPSSPNGTLPFTVDQRQQSRNHDTGASGHAAVACAERRFCSAPRHRLESALRTWSSGRAPASSTT